MNFKELFEGAEPKLPGAPKGIQIMTPQQFVAKSAEGEEPEPNEELDENLRQWFKEKWVRFGPDGKIRGACARGDDSEGKPKCLPQSKAHSLGKKGRASAAARKRREDPNPERRGPAKNVATKKKTSEGLGDTKTDILGTYKGYKFAIETQTEDDRYVKFYSAIGPDGKEHRLPKGTTVEEFKKFVDSRQGVAEGSLNEGQYEMMLRNGQVKKFVAKDDADAKRIAAGHGAKSLIRLRGGVPAGKVAEGELDEACWKGYHKEGNKKMFGKTYPNCVKNTNEGQEEKCPHCGGPMFSEMFIAEKKDACYYKVKSRYKVWPSAYASGALVKCRKKGASNWGTGGKSNESIDEATKLAAPTRPIGDPELTDYLDRIRTQQKKKTDKYKLPYIHRSSVVGYYSEDGKKYNVDAIKAALKERPKALLKKNEKMKHSDGEQEQFFNIGFAALVGIALDENTNELIIVNTCPGAGSCKIDCFAMKGGKVQFQGPWLSDGRILTYLLNDPEGFFNQLKTDISKEAMKGKKGGYKVSIRWHDAGDFFSPEYASMAFKLAESLPEVDFYAYTKVAGVALGDKPKNFMINWSEGASASQEKQVKGADSDLSKTKNSRIVPTSLFYDLLVKDEKKNLVKGPEGQWQVIPDKLPELKQRLAKEYGLSANSILSYSEWETKAKGKDKSPLKYNVIITPGEPDLTAKDAGVLSTLLLKH